MKMEGASAEENFALSISEEKQSSTDDTISVVGWDARHGKHGR
jgi:hypothetical protein